MPIEDELNNQVNSTSGTTWVLWLTDNFNSLNTSIWNVANNYYHDGNNEQSIYVADDVYIQNGNLVLRSEKRSYNGYQYTSGWVDTRNKVWQQYGKFEIYAKLPYGKGLWPAHWMMPNDNSCWPTEGEIDIMEYIGDDPSVPMGPVYGTLHWNSVCYANSQSGGSRPANGVDWTKSYHTYSVEWDSSGTSFMVDGTSYWKVAASTFLPSHPFYLILNTAVGGYWPGYPDASTVFPQYHYIDWVKIYRAQ